MGASLALDYSMEVIGVRRRYRWVYPPGRLEEIVPEKPISPALHPEFQLPNLEEMYDRAGARLPRVFSRGLGGYPKGAG